MVSHCIFFILLLLTGIAYGIETTPLLRLETIVSPSAEVFPGEKLTLLYRISYRGMIDLSVEQLPLLDPIGLQKVGEREIKDYSSGEEKVQEISQEVKALAPGKLPFPSSFLEGKVYSIDIEGKKVYEDFTLRSETAPFAITVLPFPEEGKPVSFEGALGRYLIKTLANANQVKVGDELQLSVEIMGMGGLDTVAAPHLSCQPGFSGFFHLSDLPAQMATEGQSSKTFTFSLRPTISAIQAIPSIEFSSFDPKTRQYQLVRSQPIPIVVADLPLSPLPQKNKPMEEKEEQTMAFPWEDILKKTLVTAPLEGEESLLSATDNSKEPLFKRANQEYRLGMQASSLHEESVHFNEALALYLDIAKRIGSDGQENPRLYAAIANSCYRLKEYTWTLFYGLQANALAPADSSIEHNLTLAYRQLDLPLPTRFLFSFFKLFCHTKALVVAPALLHRSVNDRSSLVTPYPLLPGGQVNAIALSNDGQWIHVISSQGTGYLPATSIRLLPSK